MKYLFVLDKYYPKPLANAVCMQNIIDDLTSKGNEVVVLCYEDELNEKLESYHGNKIYYVRPDAKQRNFFKAEFYAGTKLEKKYFRRGKLHSLSRKLLTFNYEPFYSFSFPRRIRKLMVDIVKKERIEVIVTCLHPFDGVYATYRAKKKGLLKDIPWVVYAVDNTDNLRLRKLLKLRSSHNYWCKKFLKYCTGFIYMESRHKDYEIKKFEKYQNKLFPADLPTFIVDNKPCKESTSSKDVWAYLGSMDLAHYNPHFALEFLLQTKDFSNSEYHFYSRGTGVTQLKEKEVEFPKSIFVHDYVSREEVEKIKESVTGFISIKVSKYISAKIFEYISTLKPIIHFSSIEGDPNAIYLEKYPRAVIVKESEYRSGKYTLENFYKDLESAKNRKVSFEDIEEIYQMNKPEYSARLIEEIIKKHD